MINICVFIPKGIALGQPTTILPTITVDSPTTLNQIQNDSSIGSTNNMSAGPSVSLAASGISSDPTSSIDAAAKAANATNVLQFPEDQPKYFFKIDLATYHRASITAIGDLKSYGTIILPLPSNLIESHDEKWTDPSLNTIVGGAASAASLAGGGVGGQMAAAGGAMAAAGLAGAATAGGQAIGVADAVGAVKNVGSVLEGVAFNQFMTMLYIGPKYRSMTFRWKLMPNNASEADTIRQIIRTLNNAHAPAVALAGTIWQFPDILTCSFMPNSKWLYKFKKAAIVNFTANYASGHPPAFYGSTTAGENPPEAVEITMSIVELEYWTKGNWTDSNNPADVYWQQPTSMNVKIDKIEAAAGNMASKIANVSSQIAKGTL